MKKTFIFFAVFLLTCIVTTKARAELIYRGEGLVYDTVQDITWLQNANYKGETMTWLEAGDWADSLVFQGYNDWRLPAADISCSGYECTESEMGHLFYVDNITSDSPGIFSDVNPYMYWSSSYDGSDETKAWRFNFRSGYQGTSSKTYNRYAWAVRDGDTTLPVAPEPLSSLLFLTGGITLYAGRCWKRR